MYISVDKISLRDFTASDIDNKIRWINDFDNNLYLHYDIPLNYEDTLLWFNSKNNQTRLDCTIEYCGVPVGIIGLLNIDYVNLKAEYYVCLGEKRFKRKGIAKKASEILISYAFDILNLNKVYLNVDAENVDACKLYEKLGFVCEGTFIKDMIHRGKFIDRKRYAILNNKI